MLPPSKMLFSYPGSLGEGVPYDTNKAAELLKFVYEDKKEMLRGDQVNSDADNETPEEARGLTAVQVRSRT
jgi:hypothetical protein